MPEPHKYLPLFLAEAREQLGALDSELVRLERGETDAAGWDSIFRRVHSLKGSAATLQLDQIVALSHGAEELIGRLKAQSAKPQRADVDLLFETTAVLRRRVEEVASRAGAAAAEALPGVDRDIVDRLAGAVRALPGPVLAPSSTPGSLKVPKVAVDPSIPRLDVTVDLSRNCAAPGARALIIQRKLRGLGVLLEMEPSPALLMQSKGGARIVALIATTRPPEEVRAVCAGVPEVDAAFVRVAPAVRASVPEAPAAPKSDPKHSSSPPPARPAGDAPEEIRPDATVRVRAQTLDQLLDQAAEVLHAIARLREAARKLPETHASAFETEVDRLRRTARELHGKVMDARLTPFSALTERLPRAVRDLAHRLGKEVDLEVQGADVELDRTVIESVGDPLSHLVRNAVDHGIETSAERLGRGKNARGKLMLSARRERDKVLVDIQDDGRGLDPERLREKAVELGALTREAAQALSDQAACELAFLPGLSTRAEATLVSGRGIGLDAVKGAVEALGGKLGLHSVPGLGARFTLELPLSVSMANLLLVQVGGELYGLPLHRVIATTEYDLSARGGEGFEARSLAVMGQLVRAYSLAKLFGLPSLSPPGPRPFVVLEVDGVRFALSVDRFLGQEEAVLRPLFPPLDRVRGLAGTTVLGTGRPLLVLDPRGLWELAEPPGKLAAKGAA